MIAPGLATLGLLIVAIYATRQFGFLIGDPSSVLAWLLPSQILVATVIGAASASVLRSREPEAFRLMGRNRQLQLHEPEAWPSQVSAASTAFGSSSGTRCSRVASGRPSLRLCKSGHTGTVVVHCSRPTSTNGTPPVGE